LHWRILHRRKPKFEERIKPASNNVKKIESFVEHLQINPATARLLANAHENSCIVWRPREGPTEFSNKQLH